VRSRCSVVATAPTATSTRSGCSRRLARANQAEPLTNARAAWTTQLWHPPEQQPLGHSTAYYIDGHRKPVYTEGLIPRGLVGRLRTVLGCRALLLLHDEEGHPLLATTHCGDLHLTVGLPSIVARDAQQAGMSTVKRIIVDREGMAAEFLAALHVAGRTVISVLRTDQYGGLESFTDIGSFVPLRVSTSGKVMTRPWHLPPWPSLCPTIQASHCFYVWPSFVIYVLMSPLFLRRRRWSIRSGGMLTWTGMIACGGTRAGRPPQHRRSPPLDSIIPIVTTASTVDAVELAQTYTQRWSAQENIIRDFLLPLGLEIV
jgi:hypothetical protein